MEENLVKARKESTKLYGQPDDKISSLVGFALQTHISDKRFLMLTNSGCLFGLSLPFDIPLPHQGLKDEHAFLW